MRPFPSLFSIVLLSAVLTACGERANPARPAAPTARSGLSPYWQHAELSELRAFEQARRQATDFRAQPASDRRMGAQPRALTRLPETGLVLGLLGGADALVVLAADGSERARLPAPSAPSSIAVTDDGRIFVAGEFSDRLDEYRQAGEGVQRVAGHRLDGVLSIRDLAVGPEGVLYGLEETRGQLLIIRLEPASGEPRVQRSAACRGPLQVERVGPYLLTGCLHERAVVVHRVDSSGVPVSGEWARIAHDGPIWAFDARLQSGPRGATPGLVIAATGVEDRPLDRSRGFFGNIDSHAYLYRLPAGAHPQPKREAMINLSEVGVVTPKWIGLRDGADGLGADVTGYASPRWAHIDWSTGQARMQDEVPAGLSELLRVPDGLLAANPLLDAWVTIDHTGRATVRPIAHEGPARTLEERLGEALLFTELMAPWNRADGARSRFTCEACHFEGYGDGRVHYTGRGQVHASTKPLLGLFNNRPHFSRALDRDLTQMVHAEFRVANKTSERDPWFSVSHSDAPWLRHLGAFPERISPVFLRRALMSFLMAFSHRPNPAVVGRSRFSPTERAGAALFRDRCQQCHRARLSADEPATEVSFARWPELIFDRAGPLVWALDEYRKAGVTPYVHERGARVPSLRRLYKKWPYFTDGSAHDLEQVVAGAAEHQGVFYHAGAPAGADRLTAAERAQLVAFLRLL